MRIRNVLAGLAFVLLVFSCLMGPIFILETPFMLMFGWVLYMNRVLPDVTVDPSGLATGLVCLTLFTVGAHAFLRWLFGEVRGPGSPPWRWKWTGALVVSVILMFTAGMAATGVVHQVGWLLTSRERWLNDYMVAARRSQSVNNLKQIGLAAWSYQTSPETTFPPGLTLGDDGEMLHSWQTLILPYIEQVQLYNTLDLRRPWSDPVNSTALGTRINTYLIPVISLPAESSGLALSHYEGNVRVLGGTKGLRVADVPDGTSNTILAGEVAGGYQPWGKPGHWRDPADGINRASDRGLGSPFPGVANTIFMDGSVRFLKNTINPSVLRALSTPAGGEAVSPGEY